MIYNADLILSNTPINSSLVIKLTLELYIFLWGNHPIYGINWDLYKTQENINSIKYAIPVHILLINQEFLLFLGDEIDLPSYDIKISKIAIKGLNFQECGGLIFNMLLELI